MKAVGGRDRPDIVTTSHHGRLEGGGPLRGGEVVSKRLSLAEVQHHMVVFLLDSHQLVFSVWQFQPQHLASFTRRHILLFINHPFRRPTSLITVHVRVQQLHDLYVGRIHSRLQHLEVDLMRVLYQVRRRTIRVFTGDIGAELWPCAATVEEVMVIALPGPVVIMERQVSGDEHPVRSGLTLHAEPGAHQGQISPGMMPV